MGTAQSGQRAQRAARVCACVLLALAGAALAVGAVFDLWLSQLNFGGPQSAPGLAPGHLVGHLLLVAVGLLGPIAAARALLGRIRPGALAVAVVLSLLLVTALALVAIAGVLAS